MRICVRTKPNNHVFIFKSKNEFMRLFHVYCKYHTAFRLYEMSEQALDFILSKIDIIKSIPSYPLPLPSLRENKELHTLYKWDNPLINHHINLNTLHTNKTIGKQIIEELKQKPAFVISITKAYLKHDECIKKMSFKMPSLDIHNEKKTKPHDYISNDYKDILKDAINIKVLITKHKKRKSLRKRFVIGNKKQKTDEKKKKNSDSDSISDSDNNNNNNKSDCDSDSSYKSKVY